MTEAVCLSVSGDWLKLAPDVAWHPESQGDNELLTFKRASLGHCSARKIWQTRTLSLSSVLGGGVALTASSEHERCHGRRSHCGWVAREAQIAHLSCLPLIFSPSLDQ